MSKEAITGGCIGDYYAVCDVCSGRFFASSMRIRWDNFFVCTDDFEERHPQDFIKPVREERKVPITRPARINNNHVFNNDPMTSDNDTGNWYGNGEIS